MTAWPSWKSSVLFFSAMASLLVQALSGPPHVSTESPVAHENIPTYFHHQALTPVPFTDKEAAFYRNFPGNAAAFIQGDRRLIWRMVEQPTRKMHPARDCFRGMGYRIEELGLRKDPYEKVWSSFLAHRDDESLRVSEAIHDATGGTCSDVSAWFWEACLNPDQGPWTYWVLIERTDSPTNS